MDLEFSNYGVDRNNREELFRNIRSADIYVFTDEPNKDYVYDREGYGNATSPVHFRNISNITTELADDGVNTINIHVIGADGNVFTPDFPNYDIRITEYTITLGEDIILDLAVDTSTASGVKVVNVFGGKIRRVNVVAPNSDQAIEVNLNYCTEEITTTAPEDVYTIEEFSTVTFNHCNLYYDQNYLESTDRPLFVFIATGADGPTVKVKFFDCEIRDNRTPETALGNRTIEVFADAETASFAKIELHNTIIFRDGTGETASGIILLIDADLNMTDSTLTNSQDAGYVVQSSLLSQRSTVPNNIYALNSSLVADSDLVNVFEKPARANAPADTAVVVDKIKFVDCNLLSAGTDVLTSKVLQIDEADNAGAKFEFVRGKLVGAKTVRIINSCSEFIIDSTEYNAAVYDVTNVADLHYNIFGGVAGTIVFKDICFTIEGQTPPTILQRTYVVCEANLDSIDANAYPLKFKMYGEHVVVDNRDGSFGDFVDLLQFVASNDPDADEPTGAFANVYGAQVHHNVISDIADGSSGPVLESIVPVGDLYGQQQYVWVGSTKIASDLTINTPVISIIDDAGNVLGASPAAGVPVGGLDVTTLFYDATSFTMANYPTGSITAYNATPNVIDGSQGPGSDRVRPSVSGAAIPAGENMALNLTTTPINLEGNRGYSGQE